MTRIILASVGFWNSLNHSSESNPSEFCIKKMVLDLAKYGFFNKWTNRLRWKGRVRLTWADFEIKTFHYHQHRRAVSSFVLIFQLLIFRSSPKNESPKFMKLKTFAISHPSLLNNFEATTPSQQVFFIWKISCWIEKASIKILKKFSLRKFKAYSLQLLNSNNKTRHRPGLPIMPIVTNNAQATSHLGRFRIF